MVHAITLGVATVTVLFIPLIDLWLSDYLKKKHLLYPETKFECFCGYTQEMWGPLLVPVLTYRFFKVKRHMSHCLLWILNADFNGLTPFRGSMYAATKDRERDTFFLEYAKKKSKEERNA